MHHTAAMATQGAQYYSLVEDTKKVKLVADISYILATTRPRSPKAEYLMSCVSSPDKLFNLWPFSTPIKCLGAFTRYIGRAPSCLAILLLNVEVPDLDRTS